MKRLIIFGTGLFIFLTLIFRPLALVRGKSQEYSENKILIKYEIYGCGSLVTHVIKGGESMAGLLIEEYQDIAAAEACLRADSDKPY